MPESTVGKQEVKGASTEKLPWYQWLISFWYVIVALVIALWWIIAAVRRRRQIEEASY